MRDGRDAALHPPWRRLINVLSTSDSRVRPPHAPLTSPSICLGAVPCKILNTNVLASNNGWPLEVLATWSLTLEANFASFFSKKCTPPDLTRFHFINLLLSFVSCLSPFPCRFDNLLLILTSTFHHFSASSMAELQRCPVPSSWYHLCDMHAFLLKGRWGLCLLHLFFVWLVFDFQSFSRRIWCSWGLKCLEFFFFFWLMFVLDFS